ncbi:hypothetical protein CMEL01_07560 [Colletotrichum melonis]|uniref:Uncharacterized protein n=1 Tax=Colletotrichum melonis TaxID=1209925 RepID=A0AAI9XHF9_9PEZI|nr:hypothetical protein CMEL01_07560 [Colletotrichum melonis]
MNTFKSEAQWSDLPQEIRGKILEYVPGGLQAFAGTGKTPSSQETFGSSKSKDFDSVGEPTYPSINLEISASSPNDVGNSCGIEELLDYWQQQQRYVFAPISLGDFSLPYVNCVTGLSIVRRNMRRIQLTPFAANSVKVSTEIALNSLRTMEASQYTGTELFRQWYSSESQPVFYPTSSHSMEDSLISDIDLTTMLTIWSYREKPLLSKIHIFEHGDLQMLYNWRLSVRPGLVGNLFIRSLDLEKLVICNIVDAYTSLPPARAEYAYLYRLCHGSVCVF